MVFLIMPPNPFLFILLSYFSYDQRIYVFSTQMPVIQRPELVRAHLIRK